MNWRWVEYEQDLLGVVDPCLCELIQHYQQAVTIYLAPRASYTAAACEADAAEVDLRVDEPAPVPLPVPAAALMTAGEHLPCYVLAVLAEAVEATHPAAPGDVWSDDAVLHYLQQDAYASGSSHAQRRRVRKRARMYQWQSDKLYRAMADGCNRQVPPPAQRMQLVKDTHEHTGHFGEKRTMSLLCNGYWWRGMLDDVRAVVGS